MSHGDYEIAPDGTKWTLDFWNDVAFTKIVIYESSVPGNWGILSWTKYMWIFCILGTAKIPPREWKASGSSAEEVNSSIIVECKFGEHKINSFQVCVHIHFRLICLQTQASWLCIHCFHDNKWTSPQCVRCSNHRANSVRVMFNFLWSNFNLCACNI